MNVESGVPVACEYLADTYHSGACKHRVAVEIRDPVLKDHGETDDDCDLLPGDYPYAHCYIEKDAEWLSEDD